MKIIYITYARIPTERAHGVQIMKMCEAFASLGCEVELVVPNINNNILEDPFDYYSIKKNFTLKKVWAFNIRVTNKITLLIQYFSSVFSSLLYVLKTKPDFVYSRDELFSSLVVFFRGKTYFEVHARQDHLFNSCIYKKGTGVVAITEGLKRYYLNKYKIPESKILVASDAVDLEEFDLSKNKEDLRKELNLPINRKILGYIGKLTTMGENKGVEDLILSFTDILKNNHIAFLLLVGANKNEVDNLVKIFRENKIDTSSYKIVTHVSRKNAIKYMKASDVLIMNYPNTEHYAYYMSPLKMFEYMASGAVVVTTDLPSIREILDERTAVFVKTGDSQDLVNKMNNLLRQEGLISKISKACLEKVKGYTWKDRASNILKFIKIK